MEDDDDMGESYISARLRRLREEGDTGSASPFAPTPMRKPHAEIVRESVYVQMEVDVEKIVPGEDGRGAIEIERVGVIADATAGAFEMLIHRNWIKRPADRDEMREIRQLAGFRFRKLVELSRVSALQAQNIENAMAPKSGEPGSPSEGTIDAIKKIQGIEREVGAELIGPVRSVVCDDVAIWEGKTGRAVGVEVDKVLKGLDHLAVYYGMLTIEEATMRWSPAKPRPAGKSASPEMQVGGAA